MTISMCDKTDIARPELEPLLKINDLQRLFQVDRRTIARWCKRGVLPLPVKLGRSNRWKVEEIARALDRANHCENHNDWETAETAEVAAG